MLLVEDDRDLGDAVAVILEDEGYAVARAANGLEALDRLREETGFCAVLLDARMPVMSGLEFRRLQLREPGIAGIPVIAFSADPRERAEIEALGVDRWLSKPVRVDELVEMIGGLCQDDQARGPRRLAAV